MNNHNILVVEDEKDIAIAIEAYLINQGYKLLEKTIKDNSLTYKNSVAVIE